MPAPFKQINRDEFAALLEKFDFKRTINAVHMHHTWRPNHSQYDKTTAIDHPRDVSASHQEQRLAGHRPAHHHRAGRHDLARAQLEPAARQRRWAQRQQPDRSVHVRDHRRLRPSAAIRSTGEQRKTVLEVIARVQMRFNLAPETLRFHNAMSPKSCPGTAIDYDEIVKEVRALHQTAGAAARARGAQSARRGRFGPEALEINQRRRAGARCAGARSAASDRSRRRRAELRRR